MHTLWLSPLWLCTNFRVNVNLLFLYLKKLTGSIYDLSHPCRWLKSQHMIILWWFFNSVILFHVFIVNYCMSLYSSLFCLCNDSDRGLSGNLCWHREISCYWFIHVHCYSNHNKYWEISHHLHEQFVIKFFIIVISIAITINIGIIKSLIIFIKLYGIKFNKLRCHCQMYFLFTQFLKMIYKITQVRYLKF